MKKAFRVAMSIAILAGVATLVLAIVAIWTGDGRYGATAVATGFTTLVSGFGAGMAAI